MTFLLCFSLASTPTMSSPVLFVFTHSVVFPPKNQARVQQYFLRRVLFIFIVRYQVHHLISMQLK